MDRFFYVLFSTSKYTINKEQSTFVISYAAKVDARKVAFIYFNIINLKSMLHHIHAIVLDPFVSNNSDLLFWIDICELYKAQKATGF